MHIFTSLLEEGCIDTCCDVPGPAAGVHLSPGLWAEVRWMAGTRSQCADNGATAQWSHHPTNEAPCLHKYQEWKYIQHFLFPDSLIEF